MLIIFFSGLMAILFALAGIVCFACGVVVICCIASFFLNLSLGEVDMNILKAMGYSALGFIVSGLIVLALMAVGVNTAILLELF